MTELKINLGCGGSWSQQGWSGIDQNSTASTWQPTTGGFLDLDVRDGLPFKDKSADVIFTSHALEHFTYVESVVLLFEVYRVLKVGAPICIIVPDLDIYIDALVRRDEKFLRTAEIIGGEPNKDNLTDNFLMNFYSDPTFNNTCHKYAYNFENLSSLLRMVGFRDIEKVPFHLFSYWPELSNEEFKSKIPRISEFSLCVQARKTSHDYNYTARPELRAAQAFSKRR